MVAEDVVEAVGVPAAEAAALAGPGDVAEAHGERVSVYTSDGEGVYHRMVQAHPAASATLRRSTLEDVFLRLTGRGLRE